MRLNQPDLLPIFLSSTSRQRTRTRLKPAFTLVELLVVIGIIALLVSILLPVLGKVQRSSRTLRCLSNLRQMGMAQTQYVAQWNGWAVPDQQGLVANDGPWP